MRFLEAKDTQALDGRQTHQQIREATTDIILLTDVADEAEL